VSAVGEKISYVNGDVMTQQRQHQSGSGRCEQRGLKRKTGSEAEERKHGARTGSALA